MSLCREFEATLVAYASKDGQPIGHPYQGQEAVAAGVCAALAPGDRVLSTHRAHGHAVAIGCDLDRLALELYGSGEGTCRGRAGEMYVAQPDVGYFGGTQIVAGNLPMATGLALSAKLSGLDRIAVAFVGDGGVNQGVFGEAMNLAAIWSLPVVFVVENNGYAQTTSTEYATAGRIIDRGAAYGISSTAVDGQSALEVHDVVREARQRAVRGDGPTLVEARTYRYEGHFYGDQHRRVPLAGRVRVVARPRPHYAAAPGRGRCRHRRGCSRRITAKARGKCVAAFERARTGREATLADLLDGVFVDPSIDRR